jgi:hypothetical protein
MRLPAMFILGLAATTAAGQNSFSFEISNTISPAHPSATVEVWAHFIEGGYAFAAAWFDVAATPDPAGEFSDPFAVLHTLGTYDGEIGPGGDTVTHIIAGQVQFPVGEFVADTSNPILIWQATWSTTDFTPRTIDLSTLTQRFSLYLDYDGNNDDFYGPEFDEGAGTIKVVPSPGVAAGLVVPATLILRRRRESPRRPQRGRLLRR